MAASPIRKTIETVAEKTTDTYKTIENAVVNGYTNIEDAFIKQYLQKDGETLTEAKQRLKNNL